MKIPDKKVANTQAQELKRQQISEGTEMVQKIEALRKALNSLQEQHKYFIEKSKEELSRETSELFGQKETLKAEVLSLTAVRAELQRPLDEEWKKLRDEQAIFERSREKFTVQDEKLEARERELKVREARIDITLERAEKAQLESKERSRQIQIDGLEAENILKGIQNAKEGADIQIAQRLEEVKLREDAVEFEKQGVEHVRKLNDLKEQELQEKESKLKDQHETLKRAKKELNK